MVVILVAPSDEARPLLSRLTTTSLFVQWLALVCAVSLCKLRPQLEKLTPWVGVAWAYALMLIVTAMGSMLVFWIDQALNLGLTLPPQFGVRFEWRNALLCTQNNTTLLRYFYVFE